MRAWLVTIAHHKAVDAHRAAARRALPVEVVPEPRRRGGDGDPSPLPDAELTGALATLSPSQRSVLAYRYLADLSYADIAKILETSEDAARQRTSVAVAALRRAYGPFASVRTDLAEERGGR